MEESVTYQAILGKGAARGRREEALRFIHLIGEDRLGTPDPLVESELASIEDSDWLERIGKRLLHAASWADLLATP